MGVVAKAGEEHHPGTMARVPLIVRPASHSGSRPPIRPPETPLGQGLATVTVVDASPERSVHDPAEMPVRVYVSVRPV